MNLVNFVIQLKQRGQFAYHFVAEAHPKRFVESEIHLTKQKRTRRVTHIPHYLRDLFFTQTRCQNNFMHVLSRYQVFLQCPAVFYSHGTFLNTFYMFRNSFAFLCP